MKKPAKKSAAAKPVKKTAPKAAAAKPAAKAKPAKVKAAAKPAAKLAAGVKPAAAKQAAKSSKPQAKPAPKAVAKPLKAKIAEKAADELPPKKSDAKQKGAEATVKKAVIEKAAKPVAPVPEAVAVKAKVPTALTGKGKTKGKSESANKEDTVNRQALMEDLGLEPIVEEAPLTDAEGRPVCKSKDCDQLAMVSGYCRYHYLLLWKKIQLRKKILADGKLEKYIEDLTSRYPDKYIEMIRRDLRTEKDFMSAIQELEIDDSGTDAEFEEESENLMDEVRGMGGTQRTGREDDEF